MRRNTPTLGAGARAGPPSPWRPRSWQWNRPGLPGEHWLVLGALKQAVEDPDLDVSGEDILVLRNAGPKGAGMPEWGMLPIPTKLLKKGVKDMLRLSDARMSGTSYGGCLLHCSPESAVGGPLALVRTGDRITVDVPARRIHLEVSDSELAARRAAWTPPPARYERGYGWLFGRHILQANEGCDFDFLETGFGRTVPEPDIF